MSGLASARVVLNDLPPEHKAGSLTTTSIPDVPVDTDRLRRLMQANGLDDSLVPAKRPEVFDFQTAVRSVETRRGKTATKGQTRQVAVGEVVTNGVESVYQVTQEIRDEQNRVIDHKKGMRVVYDKSLVGTPDPIRCEPLTSMEAFDAVKDLEPMIRLRFDATRGRLPGAKVREILRTSFRRMHGTRWANSVWFLGTEHDATLKAWRTVVKDLYNGDATFDTIPLPNTVGVREILEAKVAAHVKEDAAKLMADMAARLRDGKPVTAQQFERFVHARKELADHAAKQQETYGDQIAEVASALSLVDAQVMELWGRVA